VDFGLVSVGNNSTQILRFRNDTSAIADWRFSHTDASCHFINRDIKRVGSNESLLSRLSMVSSDASKNSGETAREISPR